MRLELEPKYAPSSALDSQIPSAPSEARTSEAAEALREGIKAAQAGNRSSARAFLLRAAELDPRSETAWLWLSSISEYPEELLVFLTNVLEINPSNAKALEWSIATRSLLAKNFVQRGIDAIDAKQNEVAVQYFGQALEHDEKNSLAWLWLASLSESDEGKLSYLEKALEFDPQNESAQKAFADAKNNIRTRLLGEARAAAVNGRAAEAEELLNAIIEEEPDAEDAWVLRSHLANTFAEKIEAYKRILSINPENTAAKAALDSINSIMDAVAPSASTEPEPESVQETAESFEPTTEDEENHYELSANNDLDAEGETYEFNTDDEDDLTSPESFEFKPESVEFTSEPEYADPSIVESLESDYHVSEQLSFETDVDEEADFVEPASFISVDTEEHTVFEEAPQSLSWNEPADDPSEEPVAYELATEEPFETPSEKNFLSTPNSVDEETSEVSSEFAPSVNPFESKVSDAVSEEFPTLISIKLDPDSLESMYDRRADTEQEDNVVDLGSIRDLSRIEEAEAFTIPMPDNTPVESSEREINGYETQIFQPAPAGLRPNTTTPCNYCGTANDIQSISCNGCLAVLTLADLELVLANNHADKLLLRQAVEKLESERTSREFEADELVTLGIGHLNLRNLQYGYNYLLEASQKNPDNVVLAGQVNALHIRLEEIRKQEEINQTRSKGKTILVVDDSPTVRKLIAGKLEKCGHEVFCSADGVEAIEQLEDLRPDLVLLDITMPRMDGYQVCKLIRSNNATKDVPVVMISGKDGFFDKVRGRMAGTSGYITKPFGPETLMKAVESYLNEGV